MRAPIRRSTIATLLSIGLLTAPAASDELKGKVTAVNETSVEVVTDSDLLPRVGDKVEIFIELKAIKSTALVTTGTVTLLKDNNSILVRIDNPKASVIAGQLAKIESAQPVKKTAGATAPVPPDAPATPPRQLKLVCAVRGEFNISQIVTFNADGTDLKALTNTNPGDNTYPAWSPDGSQIVYRSGDAEGGGLFVMNADGSNRRKVTSGEHFAAAWSPDGKTLVFMQSMPAKTQILVASISAQIAKTHTLTSPTYGSFFDNGPAWSPDGKQILFASNRSGKISLYTMDAHGQNVQERLKTENTQGDVYPAWSPEGKQIVYTDVSPANGTQQLFRIDDDGSHKVQLTNGGAVNTFAAWSPDGTKIAYLRHSSSGYATLYVINADGSNPKALFNDRCTILGSRPNWKPIK